VTAPSAQSGACSCAIATQTYPDCQTGALGIQRDDYDKQCGTFGGTLKVSGGACVSTGYVYLGANESLAPLPSIGGGCTAAPSIDLSKVVSTKTTTCEPAACATAICEGAAPSGFAACVRHDGEVPCPAAFPEGTLAGVTAVVSRCGACNCTMKSASCSNAKVEYFTDAACTQPSATLAAKAQCTPLPGPHYAYGVKYTATSSATFDPGTSAPTVDLVAKSTICCR
jgi:hypothetical protein